MAYYSAFPLIFPFRFGVAPAGNPPTRKYDAYVIPNTDINGTTSNMDVKGKTPNNDINAVVVP